MPKAPRTLLLLCATVALGCEREAPGPAECVAASERLLGVSSEQALRLPRVKAAFDELTIRCLTTPFDREFIRCLDERGQRSCVMDLERRLRAGSSEVDDRSGYSSGDGW